jgi:hypothetical protein
MKVKLKLKLARLNVIYVGSLPVMKVEVYCQVLAEWCLTQICPCRQNECQNVTVIV